jgi:predicted permease
MTVQQAQTQVTAIAARLAAAFPETNRGILGHPDQPRPMVVMRHTRLHPAFREGQAGTTAMILMAAVGLVLLITCATIANLLLSRAAARAREMAIRRALGAAANRLLIQMLTESVLLGIAGAALGLLFALWTADALPSFFPPDQARLLDASVDTYVLLYTLALALVASVLFGSAPALSALRPAAADVLRGIVGRATEGRAGSRLRTALVVVQVSLALVLLVSAGLLVRSVANALRGDLGFGTRNAVVANVELPPSIDAERGTEYLSEAAARVRAIPGVTSATVAALAPLGGGGRRGFRMERYQRRQGEDTEFPFNSVDADYFATMQIRVIAGRGFDNHDTARSAGVAIVNETLARRYFAGNAVGRHLTDSGNRVLTIVGVVKSGKYRSIHEPDVPYVYYALAQTYSRRFVILAATAGDAASRTDTVRRTLTSFNRDAAIYRVTTLSTHLSQALAGDRLTAALVGSCGALALILALVGIYGVVSYAVGRRSREIGIRVALGAAPGEVVRLVASEGFRVVLAGTVIGLPIAAVATRVLASLLFGVSASDTATFIVVPVSLLLVAMVAALIPARRSLAIDPVVVLRQE